MVQIHPSSVLDQKPQWVIFEEFVLTSKNYVRTVSTVRSDWLIEIAPHYYDMSNFPTCEAKTELEAVFRTLARNQAT